MPEPIAKTETVTVTAAGVRHNDVIKIGGIPRRVVDMRNIGITHKRLPLADGNAYALAHSQTVEVTRFYFPHHIISEATR
jgi:hypothetical protein